MFRFVSLFLIIAVILLVVIILARLVLVFAGAAPVDIGKGILAGLAIILSVVVIHVLATILGLFIHVAKR